jgi:F0F1-type ATP synthase beta subunit
VFSFQFSEKTGNRLLAEIEHPQFLITENFPLQTSPTMSNTGTIVQIIGAVIDADFSKAAKLPEIYNALEIQYVLNGVDTKLVLEVQQHLGDGWVRAVAMSTTDGLKRGMVLTDTGKPIAVPVGKQMLGRIFNVTGDLVDENVPLADASPARRSTAPRPRSPSNPPTRKCSSPASR